jgi:hypothetical protein
MATPLTLKSLLDEARAGDVIGLPAGIWPGDLYVPSGVTLTGQCPAQTVVDADGETGVTLAVGATLDSVTVRNARIGVLGEAAEVQSVVVTDADVGIDMNGGQLADVAMHHVGGALAEPPAPHDWHLTAQSPCALHVSGAVHVEELSVQDSDGIGVCIANDAALSGQGVVMLGPQSFGFSTGLFAEPGTSVSFENLVLAGYDIGIYAAYGAPGPQVHCDDQTEHRHGAAFRLRDVWMGWPNGRHGGLRTAVILEQRNRFAGERLTLSGMASNGLLAYEGSVVALEQFSALGTAQRAPSGMSSGVSLAFENEGSCASLSEGLLVDNQGVGVLALTGAEIRTEDLLIAGTRDHGVDAQGRRGRSIAAELDATIRSERLLIHDSGSFGATALRGARLHLVDTEISGGRGDDQGANGVGLYLGPGSSACLGRNKLKSNRLAGIWLDGSIRKRASLDCPDGGISDVVIEATRPQLLDGALGLGIAAVNRSQVRARRLSIADNHVYGFAATDGADVVVQDMTIRSTQPGRSQYLREGALGVGFAISTIRQLDDFGELDSPPQTTVSLVRATVANNHFAGVLVAGYASELTGESLDIRGTASVQPLSGIGLYLESGLADLNGYRIEHNDQAGVLLSRHGLLDAREGCISGHPIGLMTDPIACNEGRRQSSVCQMCAQEPNDSTWSPDLPEPPSLRELLVLSGLDVQPSITNEDDDE